MNNCPYCNIDLPEPKKRGGHLRSCALNPRRPDRLAKMKATILAKKPAFLIPCPRCGKEFAVRGVRADSRFCSQRCAHLRELPGPKSSLPEKNCGSCGNPMLVRRQRSYCNSDCKVAAGDQDFQKGLISNRPTLKKHLSKIKSHCFECGLTEWRGHKLPLEVHHIDGDASNNLPSNLQLVCPNCHSVTPSWKGKNAGSGRKSRGLRQE